MDIVKFIQKEAAASKKGVQIAHGLWRRKVCTIETAVEAFTQAGYWATAFPSYTEHLYLLHITDKPLCEKDPTTEGLQRFGPRALPFTHWPESSKVDYAHSEPRSACNVLSKDFFEKAEAEREKRHARAQLFSGSFICVSGQQHPEKIWGLLDLTTAGHLTIETTDDFDYLLAMGFDDQGEIALSSPLQLFCFEHSQYTLPIGQKVLKVTELATYSEGFFEKGIITFAYSGS